MNKILKITTLFVLLLLLLSSCNKSTKINSNIEIWSAPNTVKVMQDKDFASKGANLISIKAAKGEYEGAQLIITPKAVVQKYQLNVFDIKAANNAVISANAFTVYKQSYIQTKEKSNTNPNFPLGFYPDALIPFEFVTTKNENNIEAGKNQGLWVTVKIPTDAVAGKYSGNFSLVIDGKAYEIPVEIFVYDFKLPDQVHTQSAFLTRRDWLINGELDNSLDMSKKYFDTLLDYRISSVELPFEIYQLDDFIANAKKYSADIRCSAYSVPYKLKSFSAADGKTVTEIDYDLLKQYLKRLAKESTNKDNLLKKAYYYIYDILDEPKASSYELVKSVSRKLDLTEQTVVDELVAEGFFNNSNSDIKQSLLDIQNIITTYLNDELSADVNTFCPLINHFNFQNERATYNNLMSKGNKVWWYTCVVPENPYPSYHIDDNLMSARVMSWMQKQYNINGNLYWGTANYALAGVYDGYGFKIIDNYKDAVRTPTGGKNGDGYLLYPGKPYGSDKPFPSLRLEAIRDGLEEYEYLWLLEDIYKKNNEFFMAKNLSPQSVLNSTVYSRLYSGTIPLVDAATFATTRDEIASLIQGANSDMKLLIESLDIVNDKAKASILVNNGYELKVNGLIQDGVITGNGKRYEITINLDKDANYLDLEISKDGVTTVFKKYISGKILKLTSLDNEEEVKGVNVSKDSEKGLNKNATFAQNGGSSKITLVNNLIGAQKGADLFKPYFSIQPLKYISEFDFKKIDNIRCSVYNDSEKEVELAAKIRAETGDEMTSDVFVLKPKSWTTVTLAHVYSLSKSVLDKAVSIRYEINNSNMQKSILYVDDIYYELKK